MCMRSDGIASDCAPARNFSLVKISYPIAAARGALVRGVGTRRSKAAEAQRQGRTSGLSEVIWSSDATDSFGADPPEKSVKWRQAHDTDSPGGAQQGPAKACLTASQ